MSPIIPAAQSDRTDLWPTACRTSDSALRDPLDIGVEHDLQRRREG